MKGIEKEEIKSYKKGYKTRLHKVTKIFGIVTDG